MTWDSKLDKFDKRKELVLKLLGKPGAVRLDEVEHTSLYEFWWKFGQVRGKLVRNHGSFVLIVTPSLSADCASVLSDRHSDYARTAVVAHWRLMPTDERRRRLQARCVLEGARLDQSDALRSIEWGASQFRSVPGRLLGVQDLVQKFDTDVDDGKGRKLGWAMALMEMLVDPMLVAWVPAWVREQYERRNPFFRACLRQALDSCKDEFMKPRRKRDAVAVADDAGAAEEKIPNPY